MLKVCYAMLKSINITDKCTVRKCNKEDSMTWISSSLKEGTIIPVCTEPRRKK